MFARIVRAVWVSRCHSMIFFGGPDQLPLCGLTNPHPATWKPVGEPEWEYVE